MKRTVFLVCVFLVGTFIFTGCRDQEEGTSSGPVRVSAITATYYVANCALCHGDRGVGGSAPSHVGCSLCSSYDQLVEKIDRDMPRNDPGSCTGECASKLASYIYSVLNGNK